jgi:ferredoxin-NADP reductase
VSALPSQPLSRLVAPLIDPGTFDFWVSHLNPAWSWARPLARVVERRIEATDAVTLVLKPNRHCFPARHGVHTFKPGQHVNISAEVDGRRTTRSYSFTGIPRSDGLISITVKRVEGGHLSTHLCRDVREGDVLELGQPFGDMALPPEPQGSWLFLAAGSGITPLMSMVRSLAARQMPVDLTLIYWARTRSELCFAQELRDTAARLPRLRVQVVLTREHHLLAGELQGRLSGELIDQLLGHDKLPLQQIMACGPGGFVDTARALLSPVARSFQAEAFSPAARTPDAGTGAAATQVRVQLLRSGRSLELSSGTHLLQALEAAGLNPASGCRMGICNTCVCTKQSGTTQDVNTGELGTEPDTQVRLCVNRACTDLTLDL